MSLLCGSAAVVRRIPRHFASTSAAAISGRAHAAHSVGQRNNHTATSLPPFPYYWSQQTAIDGARSAVQIPVQLRTYSSGSGGGTGGEDVPVISPEARNGSRYIRNIS